MRASVIVRSKDEADRLRLTLTSLAAQSEPAEIVVVNDGSADHTADVVAAAGAGMDLIRVDHATPRGRSAAANAGAARASGDILIFLDGDTLAAPDFVALHLESHRRGGDIVARGETWHLRGTRFLADPENGTPQQGEEARVARMSAGEMQRARVTRHDIKSAFGGIAARAQPGIYPGAGPRRLFDLEMDALRDHPDCGVLWAAASGANQSVGKAAFFAVGGFDTRLTINEHRELALRLCRAGHRMAAVRARSYHLTHRSGWRDPLADDAWEAVFYQAHPIPAVPLMSVLWASLGDQVPFAVGARITSLPALAEAAERCRTAQGIAAVREAHFRTGPG
jgi:GT2 family glycosyltransferase